MNTVLYLDTWKRFVKEGVLDSARINKRILESWYRCKMENVDPYLNKGLHLLAKEDLEKKRVKNALLLEAATPYIERLEQSVKDSGMMSLLVDPDGYVLSLTGNENTLLEASRINFIEGARWTEKEVGTNAIGTALQTKEPVNINGAEHYSVASHRWSCSATPIYQENGQLIGVIDISCPVENSHPSMLGIVSSIAYAIEKDIRSRFYQNEQSLIQNATELAESYQQHFLVVCNNEQIIIAVSKPLREKYSKIIGQNLQDLLFSGYRIDREIAFPSNQDNFFSARCIFLSPSNDFSPKPIFFSADLSNSFVFKGECGTSESFHSMIHKVKLVAPTDATVFISGETGTGKELIAHAVHDNSPRRGGPFISINCGAIPKDLMESELFGYSEGAFTGAKRQGYKGKFEQAQNGTIFLDEIGEIPLQMQVALLRVLQERKITPIGGTKEISLDVRIITATHRNIPELVQEGAFREDLYYRLNVYPIHVPSLRERKEDIPHLVRFICQKNNWHLPITEDFIQTLQEYDWSGNIRELANVLERAQIICSNSQLEQAVTPHPLENLKIIYPSVNNTIAQENCENNEKKLKGRERIQRDLMLEALKRTKGNVTAAAKLLEIPRSTFYKRLKKFEI
ncbi:sigma-54-dependent Fis family transcriptional regulator [Cytobacillus sp. Hz8]|uniref:sigma-54-dependent Fis family transcriptional regulator n=1 Tax=Cytobacillus sp. Hz8 TaxID=3347168 RepID=UPI0035DDB6E5